MAACDSFAYPAAVRSFPVFLCVVVGCASVSATPVKPGVAKPENCALELFSSETEVKRPYEVACLVDATSGRTVFADKTVTGALEKARPEACACGADAMLILSASAKGWSFNEGAGEATAIIRAIRFIDRTPAPSAVAPATPAAGDERGRCLSNGSCHDSLTCASGLCVRIAQPAPRR